MFPLLIALLLCSWSPREDPAQADPQRVKAAVAELEKAWRSEAAAERVKAIQDNATVADTEVVKLLAKGLRDKEPDVQRAAIEALRWVNHPEALKELQAVAKDEKPFKKDPLLYASILKAVGQYGNPSSLAVLSDDPWSIQEEHVMQARLLGLGRIRTKESVEKLMDLMKVAGTQKIQNLMPDFRLALVALTGADQGNSQVLWQGWWNDNKNKLKIDPKPGELPKELDRKWKVFWGEMEYGERGKKRSERGQGDPDKKDGPEKKDGKQAPGEQLGG